MEDLGKQVKDFLSMHGFHCTDETHVGLFPLQVLKASSEDGRLSRTIILHKISATTPEEAAAFSEKVLSTIRLTGETTGSCPIIIVEDRWNSRNAMTKARLLAHMETFFPIYARNCEVRRIDKNVAAEFLEDTHSYGDASCRYRYGLYLKRHTGHVAQELSEGRTSCLSVSKGNRTGSVPQYIYPGSLVAVATFSNARKWVKGDKVIRSYEWTRYASLPGLRVVGGMGKLLKTFIKEICPDDIMSYADLEWSEGKAYEQLGFRLEGKKSPVCFRIDTSTWERSVHRGQKLSPLYTSDILTDTSGEDGCAQGSEGMIPEHNSRVFFQNFGSAKYRLKLTEYE